jgi:hypothetical protein
LREHASLSKPMYHSGTAVKQVERFVCSILHCARRTALTRTSDEEARLRCAAAREAAARYYCVFMGVHLTRNLPASII